jgi:formylglycine-generating enzyme required for sulfatase activity
MLPEKYHWIVDYFEPEGDPRQLFDIARRLEADGNLEAAATVYDRAYGLDPTQEDIRTERKRVLDALSVTEHGLHFRYIPYGSFLMGSNFGEPDEGPWHPVWLSPYWMSETPISWADYCRLMDWEPPPQGFPREWQTRGTESDEERIRLYHINKIRLQYCEDNTTRAIDWHAHHPSCRVGSEGQERSFQEVHGAPPRTDPAAPWQYHAKPIVAVPWHEARELGDRISSIGVRYSLPTEAQWEKAARGGLIGTRYTWGNEPPTDERCDFDRFHEFSIQPMKTFLPNGYGLYAVCGCVWEWTSDWYDRDCYRHSPQTDPTGPPQGEERVLRGGSWADCAEAVTVTFRSSAVSMERGDGIIAFSYSPTIGYRLCRTVVGKH